MSLQHPIPERNHNILTDAAQSQSGRHMPIKKKTDDGEKGVFAADMDMHIKKGGAAIAKVLKTDPEGRSIRELVEYHLRDIDEDTHDDLTMALALVFGEDVGRTITFPLFANDPRILAEYERLRVPERVMAHLRYLVALYGTRAEHAAIRLKQPNGLEQTKFDLNYDSGGKAQKITMKLTRVDGDSITITDEPESYLFLAYQMLEQLAGIPDLEPAGAKTGAKIADIFKKIEAVVESRVNDSDNIRDRIDA